VKPWWSFKPKTSSWKCRL